VFSLGRTRRTSKAYYNFKESLFKNLKAQRLIPLSRPIRSYHFLADLIGKDGPFNVVCVKLEHVNSRLSTIQVSLRSISILPATNAASSRP
jgi:hypothetical protein